MIENLGYYFYPPQNAEARGHPQLDINLYNQPTGAHFDPQQLTVWIVEANSGINRITITHPWHGQPQLQLCAGRIIMTDHRDKTAEAFCLGGTLHLEVLSTCTTCHIASPAPIFDLLDAHDDDTFLVTEFESLLARRQAQYRADPDQLDFEKHLIQTPPLTLFASGLVAIETRLYHLPSSLHSQQYRRAAHVVQHARETLQKAGTWPPAIPNWEDIF